MEHPRASAGVRYGLFIATVAYVGYLALLVTCDLLRVAPLGFIPRYQAGEFTIIRVQPFSVAERAGLAPGDRIRQANGQILERGADWQRVRVHLDPARPETLTDERRIRVLIVGTVVGVAAGSAVVVGYWRNPGADAQECGSPVLPGALRRPAPAAEHRRPDHPRV